MKKILTIALFLFSAFLVLSCKNGSSAQKSWEEMTIEERLEDMRTDARYIALLDSLGKVNIGPDAVCLDAVKHLYSWDGRSWVYNPDWGGVLEIPNGYLVEDDLWQAELSYHGSRIFSPDSLVLLSVYAGYQAMTYEEFLEEARTQFDSDSTFVVDVTRFEVSEINFSNGATSPMITIETVTEDGIMGLARYIYAAPGEDDVQYNISIQYPAEMDPLMGSVKEMVMQYPFSPNGDDPSY